jgi:Kef-type K+ transport system membrane component KefB
LKGYFYKEHHEQHFKNLQTREATMSAFLEVMVLLSVIVVGAKLAGWTSARLGQPMVVGEILFGLLLSPTVLNFPGLSIFTHSGASVETLHVFSELGVLMLMFLAGLETDVRVMRRVGGSAFAVAGGGLLIPFLGGWGLSSLIGLEQTAAIFVGVVIAATSISISARTLEELGKLRSKEGTTILGAAVIDDVLALLALALATSSGTPFWLVIVKIIGFIVIGVTFAPVARACLKWFAGLGIPEGLLAGGLGLLFVYALSAELIGGLAAITGAYLLGVLFEQNPFKPELDSRMRALAYGVFIPVFLVNIGLNANLLEAFQGGRFWFVLGILVLALGGKFLGAATGAFLTGFKPLEAARVGAGMIARGEVGLIVASIGIERGIIKADILSLTVVLVISSAVITPILLRGFFHQKPAFEPPLSEVG